VAELRANAIDVLYVSGYGPDAGLILSTALAQGYDLQLVGGDGLGMEEFWTVAGAAGEGTIFSARPSIHRDSDVATIRATFRLRGLGPGTGGLGAYAAVELWAEAVERAGTDDTAAVATELRYGHFQTVLGPVAFDPQGDLRGAAWEMQIWTDGDYAPLDRRLAVPTQ